MAVGAVAAVVLEVAAEAEAPTSAVDLAVGAVAAVVLEVAAEAEAPTSAVDLAVDTSVVD
jgi:hypothetical protein